MRRPEAPPATVPEQAQEPARTLVREPVNRIKKMISRALLPLVLAAGLGCGAKPMQKTHPIPKGPQCTEAPFQIGEAPEQCVEDPLSFGAHKVVLEHESTPEGGLVFWYYVSGLEGAPVMVIPAPAWGITSDVYTDFVKANGEVVPGLERIFGEYYTIVRLDTRGSGRSERPGIISQEEIDEFFAFDNFPRDLEALRKQLRVQIIGFIAHSMGAPQALTYAANYPDHVSPCMWLIAPALLQKDEAHQAEQEPAFAFLQTLPGYPMAMEAFVAAQSATTDSEFQGYFGKMAAIYFYVKNAEDLAFYNSVLGSLDYSAVAIGAWTKSEGVIPPELAKNLPGYMRVVAVRGQHDAHSLKYDMKLIRAIIPNTKSYTMEGVGHMPQIENPERFMFIVRENIGDMLCYDVETLFRLKNENAKYTVH